LKADTQSAVMDCYSAAGLEVGLGLACFKSSLPKNGWKSALATEMPKAFKDPFLVPCVCTLLALFWMAIGSKTWNSSWLISRNWEIRAYYNHYVLACRDVGVSHGEALATVHGLFPKQFGFSVETVWFLCQFLFIRLHLFSCLMVMHHILIIIMLWDQLLGLP
jgi:hypothetical protein